MEINVSRAFRKLRPGVDDLASELKNTAGLSIVSIGRIIEKDGSRGRFYHEDGVYDFALMTPADNGYCFAEVLKADGTMEKVKLSYDESGILVPDDEISVQVDHPGSLRKPHNSISAKKILEAMTEQVVFVNDNKPVDNSTYSTRLVKFCNWNNYEAQIIDSEGKPKCIDFNYNEIAGILVPEKVFPKDLIPARAY